MGFGSNVSVWTLNISPLRRKEKCLICAAIVLFIVFLVDVEGMRLHDFYNHITLIAV